MHRGLAKGRKASFATRLGLACVAGFLAWGVGPFGFLDKDVVSEVPAWILPGIIFGALLLVPHGGWGGPGRAVLALGIGVFAWAAAFAVGGFGWWILGWLSFAAAGLVSGVILGLLVPRLVQSRHHWRYLLVLSFAGCLGGIPFAMGFRAMDWKDAFFAPEWVIPSHIFWNMVIATALNFSATRDA